MKIDIPDEKIARFLIDMIIPGDNLLSVMMVKEDQKEISKLIVNEILTKYANQIKWPKISKQELKAALLDAMVERKLNEEE